MALGQPKKVQAGATREDEHPPIGCGPRLWPGAVPFLAGKERQAVAVDAVYRGVVAVLGYGPLEVEGPIGF